MTPVVLSVRSASAHYARREVFSGVSFNLRLGQSVGVVGAAGAGKTTLLRILAGFIKPTAGEVLICGRPPHDALRSVGVAYFAGAATLPPAACAAALGALGNGERVTTEHRPIRALSHGSRQLLGLRTVLSRQPLQLVILDEPWEALDKEGARWLSATLELKRDRGAAVVVSSHRLHDLAGFCDAYLFLVPHQATVLKAHEISRVGPVTAAQLADTFEKLRDRTIPILRELDTKEDS